MIHPSRIPCGRRLRDFLRGYGHPETHAAAVRGYCRGLFDEDSPYVRSGCGIALAAVPHAVVLPLWPEALDHLARASNVETAAVAKDADARVKAIGVRPDCVSRYCSLCPDAADL